MDQPCDGLEAPFQWISLVIAFKHCLNGSASHPALHQSVRSLASVLVKQLEGLQRKVALVVIMSRN
eukprot:1149467-Pelagomonas_calceolata.AAC.5